MKLYESLLCDVLKQVVIFVKDRMSKFEVIAFSKLSYFIRVQKIEMLSGL